MKVRPQKCVQTVLYFSNMLTFVTRILYFRTTNPICSTYLMYSKYSICLRNILYFLKIKIRIKDIIRENSKSLDTEFVSDMTWLSDCKMFLARLFQWLILIIETKPSKPSRIRIRSNFLTKSNSLWIFSIHIVSVQTLLRRSTSKGCPHYR